MLLDGVQYEYTAPDPVAWSGFGSHKEIENDFVTDSRAKIHLTVKLAPRKADPNSRQFSDRNVEDVKDGYVSCDPFQDTTQWGQVGLFAKYYLRLFINTSAIALFATGAQYGPGNAGGAGVGGGRHPDPTHSPQEPVYPV